MTPQNGQDAFNTATALTFHQLDKAQKAPQVIILFWQLRYRGKKKKNSAESVTHLIQIHTGQDKDATEGIVDKKKKKKWSKTDRELDREGEEKVKAK